MLHEFLASNRSELITRCREKVAQRPSPQSRGEELDHGITPFLEQIIETLQLEQTSEPMRGRAVSGDSGGDTGHLSEIGVTASEHGRELLRSGFTIEQVVHDYGDLCQAITDLAFEQKANIEVDEFRTLNRCLDNAIAGAVTEFNSQHDVMVADQQAQALNHQLGVFAHELRNLIHTATLALSAIKTGSVGLTGATGAILDRSLVRLSNLIDRSLAEVRMTAGVPLKLRLFSLAEFIGEVQVFGALEAQVRECRFGVLPTDPKLAVEADRDLLLSAVGNLLQNAFKFTHRNSEVTLRAYAKDDRILIDVQDQGDGLPPGKAETMFLPFTQGGEDRSGLGLGLSISRRSVEAVGGALSARNLPEGGCVFTIDLPHHLVAASGG
jgi:signal transduction histidine kinase